MLNVQSTTLLPTASSALNLSSSLAYISLWTEAAVSLVLLGHLQKTSDNLNWSLRAFPVRITIPLSVLHAAYYGPLSSE